MSKRYRFGMCALLAVVLAAGGVLAGDLTPPGPPGGTMRTLQEIYDKIEAIGGYVGFEGGDALASEILSGRKAWVGGAEVTGTMPNVGQQNLTPGTATQTITQGYHDGTGSVAGDADLVTGNIRAGVNIFGITGDANVVNTSSGNATAGDLLAGKKAWVDGAEVTGTIATWTLSAANDTVQAGYYAATTLSAVDADLAAANIKAGVNVFGVAGSVVESTGNATVGQVLAGATFSKSGESGLTGTMPNVGQQNLTPGTATQTITQGYHDGTGSVAGDADLVAGNIKKDVTIFGVTGTHEGGGGGTYNAAVPKTGQTTSYLTGDDGAHQKGVAWPNPRFTDHSNGTVTDNLTGLMWVKAPHSLPGNSGTMTWNNAIDFCNVLSFAGHSDWRLPNVRELQSLIDYGRSWPALPSGHPFTGVQSDWYWSSSTIADFTGYAWRVYLYFGLVNDVIKTGTCSVWPVRAGQ